MLKKSLLLFVCLMAFGFASASETCAQLNMKGTGAFGGCVSDAYQIAFGRSAQPQELGEWRKAGFDESNCSPYDDTPQVAEKLKATLRTPQGAKELANTIKRGYEDSLGRAPKAADLDYWTTEIASKQKNLGYTDIINAHRQWLKDDKNQADRTYAIYQAYLNGIGRAPNPGDLEYWRNRMKQHGSNYLECFKANILYITGSSSAQVQERLETIKRAFAMAHLAPTAEMLSQTSALVTAKKPHFKRLTELVVATFPNAQKQYNFPK